MELPGSKVSLTRVKSSLSSGLLMNRFMTSPSSSCWGSFSTAGAAATGSTSSMSSSFTASSGSSSAWAMSRGSLLRIALPVRRIDSAFIWSAASVENSCRLALVRSNSRAKVRRISLILPRLLRAVSSAHKPRSEPRIPNHSGRSAGQVRPHELPSAATAGPFSPSACCCSCHCLGPWRLEVVRALPVRPRDDR